MFSFCLLIPFLWRLVSLAKRNKIRTMSRTCQVDQNNQNFRLVTHPYHPVHTKTAQLVLCWSDVGDALFSADHEGVIYAWDPEKLKDTGRLQGLQDDGGKKPTEVRIQNVLNDFIGLKL